MKQVHESSLERFEKKKNPIKSDNWVGGESKAKDKN